MEKKIIFLDLDGTLLNDHQEITPENHTALQRAVSAGHLAVIATGRACRSARIQAARLGMTDPGCYAITANSAQIYDLNKNETIFRTGIPLECIRPIFDAAHAAGLHVQTYTDEFACCEKDSPCMDFYHRTTLMPYQIVPDVMKYLQEPPVKILFTDLESRARLEAFRDQITPFLEKYDLNSTFSCDYYLEIAPSGINKGFGVRYMSRIFHVAPENTIAVGDAENDISMLKAAGIACVMKNASADMEAYADYITQNDNNHSGVAEVIEKFML